MMSTPISTEDYLRKEISKANTPQVDAKLNKLIDYFAPIKRHQHLQNTGREVKDKVSKTLHSPV